MGRPRGSKDKQVRRTKNFFIGTSDRNSFKKIQNLKSTIQSLKNTIKNQQQDICNTQTNLKELTTSINKLQNEQIKINKVLQQKLDYQKSLSLKIKEAHNKIKAVKREAAAKELENLKILFPILTNELLELCFNQSSGFIIKLARELGLEKQPTFIADSRFRKVKDINKLAELNCSGLYYIYNSKTNKYYIGSTDDIFGRLQQHVYDLNNNAHINSDLQKDWQSGDWSYSLIGRCENKDLLKYENIILDLFPKDLSYNKTPANCPMPKTINEKRFWSNVEKTDGCWLWIGYKNDEGYGQYHCSDHTYGAHRISYYLATGDDPRHFVVRHKCCNKSCVNPDHLCVGSHKDNANDARQKIYESEEYRMKVDGVIHNIGLGHSFFETAQIMGCNKYLVRRIAKRENIVYVYEKNIKLKVQKYKEEAKIMAAAKIIEQQQLFDRLVACQDITTKYEGDISLNKICKEYKIPLSLLLKVLETKYGFQPTRDVSQPLCDYINESVIDRLSVCSIKYKIPVKLLERKCVESIKREEFFRQKHKELEEWVQMHKR